MPRSPSLLPLVLTPALIFGGIYASVTIFPVWVEDLYQEYGLPLLITFWIGAGFTYAWDVVRYQAHIKRTPTGVVATVGILGALVLLSMLGGARALWEDAWLFGAAVWPGLTLARPLLDGWHELDAGDGDRNRTDSPQRL